MTQWMAEVAKGRDIGGREIQGCEDPETEMERRCIQRERRGPVWLKKEEEARSGRTRQGTGVPPVLCIKEKEAG